MKEFRGVFFPYCLECLEDGRYVVLNRAYKPLGFLTSKWVEYTEYPVCVKLNGLGPVKARRLSHNGSEKLDRIYLYNDGCVPTRSPAAMKSYMKKLQLLATLQVG